MGVTSPLLTDERMEAVATRKLPRREAGELAKVSDEMRLIGVAEAFGQPRPTTIVCPIPEIPQGGSDLLRSPFSYFNQLASVDIVPTVLLHLSRFFRYDPEG